MTAGILETKYLSYGTRWLKTSELRFHNILLKIYKIDFSQVLYNFRYFPFSTYITHNLEHYIKQKLLKNVIWGRHYKILAKRKVFLKFWFGYTTIYVPKNDRGELTPCWVLPDINEIFGYIINYLLTSFVGSALEKYRTTVFLRSLDARSVTKNVAPIFHYSTDLTLGGQ